MASRILTNSGLEIEQTLSTGYLALVVRGIGLVRDTGVQNITGQKYFYDVATLYSGVNIVGKTVVSGNIEGNLSPETDNTYDLGSSTGEWRNLFVDGIARIDNLHVDESANVSGNLSVLGSVNVTGTTNLLGDFVPTNVASNFLPKTDNLYDLGSPTQEFRNLWIDGSARVDSLHVDENANITGTLSVLGSATISGTFSSVGDFVPTNVAANLLPKTDNLYDLGSSSQEFKDLWIDGIARIDQLHVDESANVSGSLTAANVISNGSGVFSTLFVTETGVPLTTTSAGVRGQIVIGGGHLYACTGTNLWARTHLTGWV
jgi:hypothetical protein